MGVSYQAVGWNRQKKVYDRTLLAGLLVYLALFLGVGFALHPQATAETLLLRAFDHTKERVRGYFKEDPTESFREHVWINPLWEDDIAEVVEHMGVDRVILGSDWPHMEGLEHPRDILEELDGITAVDQEKILYANAKGLNERRPL